jgi:acetyl esterase/lipase
MFKNLLIVTLITANSLNVQAQTPHRYKDIIFADVSIDKDLSYHPVTDDKEKKSYLFDLYQPKGDNELRRPLIIWMHGGGFKYGSKDAKGIKLWCKTFAQRGYVCVGLNYRLSKKNPVFHFDELLKASYYAVNDVGTAVEYFKRNAVRYHIDPDKIILAGNSAGGIMALQAAYNCNEQLARLAKIPADSISPGEKQGNLKVAAVINFWGAMFNLDWLKNERVPIVTVLGGNDHIVPPTHQSAPLFGGEDISEKATALGIPNQLKVFDGYGHELQRHFNPFFSGGGAHTRWLEAGQFAADFLYKTIF